jgi:hypothetical protein
MCAVLGAVTEHTCRFLRRLPQSPGYPADTHTCTTGPADDEAVAGVLSPDSTVSGTVANTVYPVLGAGSQDPGQLLRRLCSPSRYSAHPDSAHACAAGPEAATSVLAPDATTLTLLS